MTNHQCNWKNLTKQWFTVNMSDPVKLANISDLVKVSNTSNPVTLTTDPPSQPAIHPPKNNNNKHTNNNKKQEWCSLSVFRPHKQGSKVNNKMQQQNSMRSFKPNPWIERKWLRSSDSDLHQWLFRTAEVKGPVLTWPTLRAVLHLPVWWSYSTEC